MNYKIKRIDNLVIVVGTTIMQRYLSEGEDGNKLYSEIEEIVESLNSDILPEEEIPHLKNELYTLMNPVKYREKLMKQEKELSIYNQTIDLAGVKEVRAEKGKKVIAIDNRFEQDDDDYVYLKGFSVPLPEDLIEAILDATYNPESKYTLNSLINFWQWAVLNPNPKARNDLFGWFSTGNFSITDEGMIVAYRCVNVKKNGINKILEDFVNREFTKIKSWKKSPKNYLVVKGEDGYYTENINKSIADDEVIGTVSDVYADINTSEGGTIYTDNHTGTFTIKMGEPVSMPRKDCNEDSEVDCSTGLMCSPSV